MGRMSSKQASQKKELGHAEERTFNAFFGNKESRDTNFSGANADNIISNIDHQNTLKEHLGEMSSFQVSLKSGKTWQFHLGRIDELSPLDKILISKTSKNETKVTHFINFEEQKSILKNYNFWNKYLGKGNLLCYNDKEKKYTFFKMNDVIQFIINSATWRLLDTGRIKGDFIFCDKKRSVITFEYRKDKNQFVLGAHGGNAGFLLFEILEVNLQSSVINFKSQISKKPNFSVKKRKFSSSLDGKIGDTFFDDNYLYICIEKNKWKRITLENIT